MSVTELLDRVFAPAPEEDLIIGIGNSLRSDDGIGPLVADRLMAFPRLRVENIALRPEACIDLLTGCRPRQVVIFDAADFSGAPGELRLIDRARLPGHALTSHRLPLAPMLEWIEFEYATPCHCLGIQPASLHLGEQLTPQVSRTADLIVAWFADWFRQSSSG
ncbi:MAG: hydrogenase maturation protease [Desulfuromonadales bacterium]|nr:hydrogenase maturation protease [Desulfuromonadales bacterium]